MIQIEEDRRFLLAQRDKGRRGSMAGVDTQLAGQEERKAFVKRKEQLLSKNTRKSP